MIAAASAAGIPIRIGVNAGSLDDALAARDDLTLPEKLAASATEYVRFFEDECDFHDLVVSAKAHDVQTTIDTYRLLAAELPEVPLHIGVTEAGTAFQGIIKSAMRPGRSFGRGYRRHHAHLAHGRSGGGGAGVLDAARRTRFAPPQPRAHQLPHLRPLPGEPHWARARSGSSASPAVDKPVKVAVMGCVVNGPGEAADADIGVACGAGAGVVFSHGKIVRKVQESEIVSALMEELENL